MVLAFGMLSGASIGCGEPQPTVIEQPEMTDEELAEINERETAAMDSTNIEH